LIDKKIMILTYFITSSSYEDIFIFGDLMKPIVINDDLFNYLPTLASGSIDVVIVDPPYNLGMDNWDSWPSNTEYGAWCQSWGKQCFRVLKDNGAILSFSSAKTYHWLAVGLESAGFKTKDMIEWVYWSTMPRGNNLKSCHEPIFFGCKKDFKLNIDDLRISEEFKQSAEEQIILPGMPTGHHPGRGAYGGNTDAKKYKKALDNKSYKMNEKGRHPYNILTNNIADFKKPRGVESIRGHPTQKPINLIEWLVELTTKEGDTILDCFAGSGTTGVAAQNLNRNIILVERESKYIDLINKRLL
jgi:DNA modification methylase